MIVNTALLPDTNLTYKQDHPSIYLAKKFTSSLNIKCLLRVEKRITSWPFSLAFSGFCFSFILFSSSPSTSSLFPKGVVIASLVRLWTRMPCLAGARVLDHWLGIQNFRWLRTKIVFSPCTLVCKNMQIPPPAFDFHQELMNSGLWVGPPHSYLGGHWEGKLS